MSCEASSTSRIISFYSKMNEEENVDSRQWSDETEQALVEEWARLESLYSISSGAYHNRQKKSAALKELERVTGMSGQSDSRLFVILHDQYILFHDGDSVSPCLHI